MFIFNFKKRPVLGKPALDLPTVRFVENEKSAPAKEIAESPL
jgi:hypothetical protein